MVSLVARAVTVDAPLVHSNATDQVALTATGGIIVSPAKAGTTGKSQATVSKEAVRAYIGPEGVKQAIEAEFGPGHIMYWVAVNESELDPLAESGTGPEGVFQIARQTWRNYKCEGDVFNAADNIKCARKIYDANGLTDWRWSMYHGSQGGWAKHL